MSTSPERSPVNGHHSPSPDENTSYYGNGHQSDSDLSDVQHAPADAGSPEYHDADADADADDVENPVEHPEVTFQGPSDSEDNDASDDGDFDAAGSPASVQSHDDHPRRTMSVSERPAPKRKAAQVVEEDFMRENPELYGLRRSVRPCQFPQGNFTANIPFSRVLHSAARS